MAVRHKHLKFKVDRMFKRNYIKFIVIGFISLISNTTSFAQDSAEDLRNEISFLAMKLLDISGEDSITIEQAGYMKPFIGICSNVTPKGVRLTCVTPGHNAFKAGLKTGDLITSINEIVMTQSDKAGSKKAYYGFVKAMKTGDSLAVTFMRKGEERSVEFKVGAVYYPAYTLTVKK